MSPYEFLQHILVTEFGVPTDRITPEATLTSLGLDSLALAELVFEIESEFDVVVPEERAKLATLGEAAALITELRESST